jgi:hypothetical protein
VITTDVARFSPYDDPELVGAAFSCPYCLGEPTELELRGSAADGTGEAACRCEPCDAAWTVGLDGVQLMRMVLAPPRRLEIAHHARP